MSLTVSEKIRLIMKRQHITVAELARRSGQSAQNLSNKLSRDNFTIAEMQRIADALECDLNITLTGSDGDQI